MAFKQENAERLVMPSSEMMLKKKEQRHRCQFIIVAIIGLIVLIYTIVWFVLAGKVEEKIAAQLQLYDERGFAVLCENMHKTGYPLRIGVACDTVNLRQSMKGFSFSSEKLTAGAPVYAPRWLELSVRAPASLELPGLLPLSAKWSDLTVETDISRRIPDAINLRAENFEIGAKAEAEALVDTSTAKFLRFDAKGLNGDLSARLTFDELNLPVIIPGENTPLPQIDGDIEWSLNNARILFAPQNESNWVERLRGHDGLLKAANITFASGGSVKISGPFAFDDEGYLTAKFEIAIADQNEMLRTARTLFPSQADNLQTIFFALSAMPKNADGDPVLALSVKHGEARLGFFKLGRIDPI